MSRWKQTLCGSVIKNRKVQFLGTPVNLFKGDSKILSSGGSFLPHPKRHLLRHKIKQTLVHLPTETHELLVVEPFEEDQRFQESTSSSADKDEMDRIEEALRQFDVKISK